MMKKLITPLLAMAVTLSLTSAHCGTCAKSSHAKVGKPAPDFSLTAADGSQISLASLKGKQVILEWVNFECPFVKKHYNEGHMQAIQKQYTDGGAVWLTIASAHRGHPTFLNSQDLDARAKKHNSNASHTLVDADGKVGKLYDAKTTPHMYVINKEGLLAYAGAIDSKSSTDTADIADSDNYVSQALDALLAGKKIPTTETKAYGCSIKYAK